MSHWGRRLCGVRCRQGQSGIFLIIALAPRLETSISFCAWWSRFRAVTFLQMSDDCQQTANLFSSIKSSFLSAVFYLVELSPTTTCQSERTHQAHSLSLFSRQRPLHSIRSSVMKLVEPVEFSYIAHSFTLVLVFIPALDLYLPTS